MEDQDEPMPGSMSESPCPSGLSESVSDAGPVALARPNFGAAQKGIYESIPAGIGKAKHLALARAMMKAPPETEKKGMIEECRRAIVAQMNFPTQEAYECFLFEQLEFWIAEAKKLEQPKQGLPHHEALYRAMGSPVPVPGVIKHLREGSFPLTGRLGYPELFPAAEDKIKDAPSLSVDELLRSQADVKKMIVERLSRQSPEDAKFVYESVMAEVQQGWAVEVFESDITAAAVYYPRFAALQRKLHGDGVVIVSRAIDDGKAARINEAVIVYCPIRLPKAETLGTVAELYHREARRAGRRSNLILNKADHKSAYRQLPGDGNLQRLITIRDPATGAVRFFESSRLLFGEVGSVVAYNGFSLTITRLMRDRFFIPLLAYYDDYAFPAGETKPIAPVERRISPLGFFMRFVNEVIRTVFQPAKTESGPRIGYLGILMSVRPDQSGIDFLLSRARQITLVAQCDSHLESGELKPREASELAGRLGFSQTSLFGRVGRAMIRPLYFRAQRPSQHVHLAISESIRASLRWWRRVISAGAFQRFIPFEKPRQRWAILYTDASFLGLGGVLFLEGKEVGIAFKIPLCIPEELKNAASIEFFEGLAILIAQRIYEFEDLEILIFVDNNNTLGSVVRGSGRRKNTLPVIRGIWEGAALKRWSKRYERVSSEDNVGDEPSRLEDPVVPFRWATVEVKISQEAVLKALEHGAALDPSELFSVSL
jgi:hypothetical protein